MAEIDVAVDIKKMELSLCSTFNYPEINVEKADLSMIIEAVIDEKDLTKFNENLEEIGQDLIRVVSQRKEGGKIYLELNANIGTTDEKMKIFAKGVMKDFWDFMKEGIQISLGSDGFASPEP